MVWRLRFGVHGSRLGPDFTFRVQGFGYRVSGTVPRVQSLNASFFFIFRDQSFGVRGLPQGAGLRVPELVAQLRGGPLLFQPFCAPAPAALNPGSSCRVRGPEFWVRFSGSGFID